MLESPVSFCQFFYQREGGQTTSVIIQFCVIYFRIKTITIQVRLWFIWKQEVPVTRLLMSRFYFIGDLDAQVRSCYQTCIWLLTSCCWSSAFL